MCGIHLLLLIGMVMAKSRGGRGGGGKGGGGGGSSRGGRGGKGRAGGKGHSSGRTTAVVIYTGMAWGPGPNGQQV